MPFHMAEDMLRLRKRLRPDLLVQKRSGFFGRKLPVKTPKKKRKIEEKTVLLLEYQDKIAIRKRREDGLLASLYEFVNVPGQLFRQPLAPSGTDCKKRKSCR